jgi:plastocyanin
MRGLGILVAVGALACSKPTPHTYQVEMRGMQFSPAALHAHVGDIVVWTNKDLVPHTATAAGSFDSGPVQPEATWSYTVTKAGELDYGCSLHPTMKAQLFAE